MLHIVVVTDQNAQINRLFRAVGDTTRRAIVDELMQRDRQSLFELYTRVISRYDMGLSRQAFSRHLRVLEDAGILEVTWTGTTKLHSLNKAPLTHLLRGWLSEFKD